MFLKNKLELTPAQVTMISFVALSFLGALFLMAPFSNTNGQWLNFVDAFFMSVSATCVTGLAVVHLGHDFTLCGQLVIYGHNLDGKHPSINSRREFQRQDAEPKLIQQHQD